jgi:hypothetical protein
VQVEIARESAFAWHNERELPIKGFLLFGGQRDYDVMPDGKRFVMVFSSQEKAGRTERPRINVVINWTEELKRLMRANSDCPVSSNDTELKFLAITRDKSASVY